MNRIRTFFNNLRNWFINHTPRNIGQSAQNFNNGFHRYFVRPIRSISLGIILGVICCLISNYFLMQQPELYNVCPEFFDVLNGYRTLYRYILYSGSKIIIAIFDGEFFAVSKEMLGGWSDLFQQFWTWFSNIQF